jgi:heptosyltransferase-3
MRLLFIKLKHIGDALLLTPTLCAVRAQHPDARICVLVRKGCEGILAGCPAIDQIFTSAAPESKNRSMGQIWDDLRLIRDLRRERFDFAFELGDGDRGRILAILSGARKRCASGAGTRFGWGARAFFHNLSDWDWHLRHRVEKDFRVVTESLPLGVEIPPLCFEESRTQPWPPGEFPDDFVVLHPGTRWRRKRWPLDRWIALGERLLGVTRRLIISAGPDADERADAAGIRSALGERAVSTDGQTNWPQLAGLLHRATLFVGVDTAAMHLAAACQCPGVAIFGPSIESAWSPWKAPHRLVMAQEAIIPRDDPDYFRKKEKLNVANVGLDAVWEACEEMLRSPASIERRNASGVKTRLVSARPDTASNQKSHD